MLAMLTAPTMREKKTPADRLPVPVEMIARRIYSIRGQKVMLDSDLAELYQVATKALNQAVKRNLERFPADFMFQLTSNELDAVNRSQIVTGSQKHRDPRLRPYAFTELGVAMLSSAIARAAEAADRLPAARTTTLMTSRGLPFPFIRRGLL
jgi:hypothetical protein